jgi:hypothetical protein
MELAIRVFSNALFSAPNFIYHFYIMKTTYYKYSVPSHNLKVTGSNPVPTTTVTLYPVTARRDGLFGSGAERQDAG